MAFKIRLYTQDPRSASTQPLEAYQIGKLELAWRDAELATQADPELWAVVHDTTHGDRHFFHQGTSQGVQLGSY